MSLTLQLRTHDNLLELLAAGESPAWVIAIERVSRIGQVHIINFNGTQRIEAAFDSAASTWRSDRRLIVRFHTGRLVNCKVEFHGRNPVEYPDE